MQKGTTSVISVILTFSYHFKVFYTLNLLIPLVDACVVKVTMYKRKDIGYYKKLILRNKEFNLSAHAYRILIFSANHVIQKSTF